MAGQIGQRLCTSVVLYTLPPTTQPLPEQYCMDPLSAGSKHTHRKRKHKHRTLEKTNMSSSDSLPTSHHAKFPSDAYSFIKHEPPSPTVLHSHPPSHHHLYAASSAGSGSVLIQAPAKAGHVYMGSELTHTDTHTHTHLTICPSL